MLARLPHISSLTLQQPRHSIADSRSNELGWSIGGDPLSKFARCISRLLEEGPPPSIEKLVLQLTEPTTKELNASLHVNPDPFLEAAATLLRFARDIGRIQLLVADARRDRLQFWKTQLCRHFPALFILPSFSLHCITSKFYSLVYMPLGAASQCRLPSI